MVNADDFRFDMYVPMGSLDMTARKVIEKRYGQGHVSHEFLGDTCCWLQNG